MRRLILLRHAKAERQAASGDDFDRALSERGRSDARLMGRVLMERGVRPDTAWVSAARRTRETWDEAQEAFGDVDVHLERALYNASAAVIRRMIEDDEGADGAVMVVGHNPGLHQVVVELLVEGAASASEIARATSRFPTATAAVFDIDAAGRPSFDGLYLAADFGGGGGE
jgi:phosphohistidine phosphatase